MNIIISKIALAQKINRRTVYKIIDEYRRWYFFLSYKQEFITETFTSVKDYVWHHNEKRLHTSLSYKTSKEVWEELKRK